MQQKMGGWGMGFDALPLGDLLSKKGYIRGPFGSALKRQELKQSGIPVYEQQQAIDGQRRFRFFIDQEKHNELRRFTVRANDLIISCSGTVGRVSVIGEGDPIGIISQALLILRPDVEKLLPRFLYYFLTSPAGQASLLAASHGAVQLNIAPRAVVEKILTPTPRIEEQRAIISVLGSLDDRITLLRETNATLEAIAQALFKSWFVDFDPVRAKMEGRAPEGMDEATAALFPDSFEESELGLVPRGWKTARVADIAEVVKGKSYSSKNLVESHHTALVTLKSFERGGGFRMDGFKPYSGAYKPAQIVMAGDLILAYTDVTQAAELIGKPAIVVGVDEFQTLVASLDVGIIRPNEVVCGKQFLYGLFRTDAFQAHTLAHTSGTTVLHLAKDGVGSYVFPLPNVQLVHSFEEIASAIGERKQTNSDAIRTLTTLRDTLLPRLISGTLRLPEAHAELEAV